MTPLFTSVELHLLDNNTGGIQGVQWDGPLREGVYDVHDAPGGQLGLMGTVGLQEIHAGVLTVDLFWDVGWRNFEEAWAPVGWANTFGFDAGVRWDRCRLPDKSDQNLCFWLDVGAGPRVALVSVRGWPVGASPALGARIGAGVGIGETRRVLVGVAATGDVGWNARYGRVSLVDGGFEWDAEPGGPGLMLRVGMELPHRP